MILYCNKLGIHSESTILHQLGGGGGWSGQRGSMKFPAECQ